MKNPKVVVVIISFNGEAWIQSCLESIMHSEHDNIEIIVVDNASKDGTLSLVKRMSNDILIIGLKKNIGYGQGANIGIRHALSHGGDYVLLLNQDIKLAKNCIESLIAGCEQNKAIGIASPLQMNYDGSHIDPHFRRLYNLKSETIDVNEGPFRGSMEVDTVIGAAMFFRATLIKAIGGFDPIYFLYHEEGDLCRRARYHGFQIHIIPEAIVFHKHNLLIPEEMTFKAKFSSTYGYYIYTLKNPYLSFHQNFHMMLKQMKKWMVRDHHLIKIIQRLFINAAAAGIILSCLHRIIKRRMADMLINRS